MAHRDCNSGVRALRRQLEALAVEVDSRASRRCGDTVSDRHKRVGMSRFGQNACFFLVPLSDCLTLKDTSIGRLRHPLFDGILQLFDSINLFVPILQSRETVFLEIAPEAFDGPFGLRPIGTASDRSNLKGLQQPFKVRMKPHFSGTTILDNERSIVIAKNFGGKSISRYTRTDPHQP